MFDGGTPGGTSDAAGGTPSLLQDGFCLLDVQGDLTLEGGGGVEFHARADEAVQFDGNRLVVEIAVEIEKMELENDFGRAVLPDGRSVADVGDAVDGLPVGEASTGRVDAVWRNQKFRDGEIGRVAGKKRRADVIAVGDVADNGERPSQQAVGEFQVTVLYGFANAGAADGHAVENDAWDDVDFDAVRRAAFAQRIAVASVIVSKAEVFTDAERLDGNLRREKVLV